MGTDAACSSSLYLRLLSTMKLLVAGLLLLGVVATVSGKFSCKTAGTFMDAKSCSIYHICDDHLNDNEVHCPSGTQYSLASSECVAERFVKCVKGGFGKRKRRMVQSELLEMLKRYSRKL